MGNNRTFLLIYLGMMSALAPLATDMYLPALPEISSFFGISTSTTQMTLTMTLVGMAVGQVLGGPVSDRLGRKLPILMGMIGFLVSAVVCSVVQDIEVFLFFRLIMGLSGAFGIVISRAVARDTEEGPELMRFMALLMMVNGLAPILAPVLGAQILRFAEWHAVFVALSIVGILMILATLVFRETLHKDNRVRNVSDGFIAFGTLMKDRYFFGHCLLQCFIFGSFFSYIAGSSFLFQNVYHVSPQTFSYIFGGIGIGLMIAGIIPARMAGAIPEIILLKWAVLVPMIGSFFFLGGILLDAPIWYSIIVLFLTITPLAVMGASSVSLALSRCGENAGSGSALIGFFSMILGGAMMPVVGIAGDHTAVPMALIMAFFYILSNIVLVKMIFPEHRHEL